MAFNMGCANNGWQSHCLSATDKWLKTHQNLPKRGQVWYYKDGMTNRWDCYHSIVWYDQNGYRTYIEPQNMTRVVLKPLERASIICEIPYIDPESISELDQNNP